MTLRAEKSNVPHSWAWISGLLAFPVYWRTLAPTLQVADAGEQITAAYFLGVSHPTGTPLYLLLMKGWGLIFPFGTIAWRMNFLNAVLSGVTIAILSTLILRLSLHSGSSRGGALLLSLTLSSALSFSLTYWHESVAASSYVMHYFFVVIYLFLFSRVIVEGRYEKLKLIYLITGLALANHVLSVVLLALVLWYSLSLLLRKGMTLKEFAVCCLFLLPGLSLYLYIPLRAASGPSLNWGSPDSLERLLHYIARKDYIPNLWVTGAGDLLDVALFHAKSFVVEFSFGMAIFAAASGIAILWTHRRKYRDKQVPKFSKAFSQLILLGIALFTVNLLLLSLHGSHQDLFFLKRYMVAGYIGLYFSCVCLILCFLGRTSRRAFGWVVPLLVLMPLGSLSLHFEKNDRSQNWLLSTYMDDLFGHLPRRAALFAEGDNHLFPVLYYHLVEGIRNDVTLFNPVVGLGDARRLPSMIRGKPVYTTHWGATGNEKKCIPRGLVFQIAAEETRQPNLPWREFSEEEIRLARVPLEKILLTQYYERKAVYHRTRNETEEQEACIKKMKRVSAGNDRALAMTGIILAQKGRIAEALRFFEASLQVNPKNRTSLYYLGLYAGGGNGPASVEGKPP